MTAKIGIDRYQMRYHPKQEVERLRQHGSIFWSNLNQRWLIVEQKLALDVLRDDKFHLPPYSNSVGSLEKITGEDLGQLQALSMFIPFLHNGIYHKSIREVLTKILVEIQPRYYQLLPEVVDDLIHDLLKNGSGDFAEDFSYRLHLATLSKVIGMPASSVEIINPMLTSENLNYNNSVSEFVNTELRLRVAYAEMKKLVNENEDIRAFHERVGRYLVDADLEDTFNNRIYAMMAVMIIGRDTIAGAISLSLHEAFEQFGDRIDGDQLASLDTKARELLRLTSPVNIIEREASEPRKVGDQAIAAGERVLVVIRAVNTDPAVYGCPHQLTEASKENDGFVFGSGIHTCIGRNLALEALRVSFQKISQLRAIHRVGEVTMGTGRNTQSVDRMTMRVEI